MLSTGSLCIIVILLVRIVQQYSSKSSSMLLPKTFYGNLVYFNLTKLLAAAFAVILLVIGGFKSLGGSSLGMTLLFSGISGVMLVLASVFGLYAIKSGTMALSSMFSTAGLIVPCIAGIFLFDDVISPMQWLGVVLFLASSYLLIGASKKMYAHFSFKTVLLLVGSMLANGVTMLMQTMFKKTVENANVSAFSFFSFIIPVGIMSVIMVFYKAKNPDECHEKLQKKLTVFAVISAVALFIVNQLATTAADLVDTVVLFTFINGGNTLIAALIAAVCFKEKFTPRSVAGLLIGIGSLVLVKVDAATWSTVLNNIFG